MPTLQVRARGAEAMTHPPPLCWVERADAATGETPAPRDHKRPKERKAMQEGSMNKSTQMKWWWRLFLAELNGLDGGDVKLCTGARGANPASPSAGQRRRGSHIGDSQPDMPADHTRKPLDNWQRSHGKATLRNVYMEGMDLSCRLIEC